MTARLRFAPSPTGYFHVGGAKTALYNWIFARQNKGVFVLRIEDTDTERNEAAWTEGILSALHWIGADWDEGPYFQSQRTALYEQAMATLVSAGRAYYCDCTREVLEARTGDPNKGYDGFCRTRGLAAGDGRALRFQVPDSGSTTVVDLIRGEPTFDNALIEDFVIARGNGSAMFLLANVVDDIDMGITHVIRAEEHLPNTPKALLLWEALGGGEPPVFAHLPVLVNEKRQKLSKRRDKVALEGYRDEGFLAEAMRNYLMLLGWAPKEGPEVQPFASLAEQFRLEDVVPSPAFFDVQKLTSFNGDHIRLLAVEEFVALSQPWLTGALAPEPPLWPAEQFDPALLAAVAPLVQERVSLLSEVPAYVDFLFVDEVTIDDAAWAKVMAKSAVPALLDAVIAAYRTCEWAPEALKDALEAAAASVGVLKRAQVPVRVAVTGRQFGMPLYEPMDLLGRDLVLRRLEAARARLG